MNASAREIEKHLRLLSVDIGTRVAGSRQEKEAAGAVENHFSRLGLETGQLRFRFPNYLPRTCRLEIVSGGKPERVTSARPMAYTPDTPTGGVSGQLCFLQTGTQHDLQQPGLRGKVGLLLGSANLRFSAFRRKLIAAKLKGLVVVDHRTEYRTPISVGAAPQWMLDFSLPVVGVPHLVAVDLLKMGRLKVSLTTQGHRVSSESQNVWAEIPGQGSAAREIIVVTCHLDSVPDAPGANDNGSGTAAVMELARILRREKLKRTVRLIGFGVEERLSVGAYLYATRQVQDANQIKLCINLDSIGAIAGEDIITTTGTPALTRLVRKVYDACRHGAEVVEDVSIYSDMFPLNMLGIPSAWCYRSGGLWAFHTRLDNFENVSPQATTRTTNTVAELVRRTAGAARLPFARKIDPSLTNVIKSAARENYSHPWNLEKALRGLA
jgi:aminopeptidase YwaD